MNQAQELIGETPAELLAAFESVDEREVGDEYGEYDGQTVPLTDEQGIDLAITHAEVAAARAAIAMADQLAAIDDALRQVADAPHVFAGPNCDSRAETLEFAMRGAVTEIAMTLGISETTVHTYASTAKTMRTRLPRSWAAFREGQISYAKARVIVEQADTLPVDSDPRFFAEFDELISGVAARLTPSKLKQKARAAREKLHPQDPETRHRTANADRRFCVEPAPDGMAWQGAFLPADVAYRASARVDATARRLAAQLGETRTLAQLRADVAADLLSGDGTTEAVRATVTVTVPVMTLLDRASREQAAANPAILDGYGPIDAETARRLCANAPSLFRLLTDPVSGAILTVDRTIYRPPADLKRLVKAIHPLCSAPGCSRLAADCDIDHLIDWVLDGRTELHNLVPLCRKHHRVKHKTRWTTTRKPSDGTIIWTSPTGNTHNADPPPF